MDAVKKLFTRLTSPKVLKVFTCIFVSLYLTAYLDLYVLNYAWLCLPVFGFFLIVSWFFLSVIKRFHIAALRHKTVLLFVATAVLILAVCRNFFFQPGQRMKQEISLSLIAETAGEICLCDVVVDGENIPVSQVEVVENTGWLYRETYDNFVIWPEKDGEDNCLTMRFFAEKVHLGFPYTSYAGSVSVKSSIGGGGTWNLNCSEEVEGKEVKYADISFGYRDHSLLESVLYGIGILSIIAFLFLYFQDCFRKYREAYSLQDLRGRNEERCNRIEGWCNRVKKRWNAIVLRYRAVFCVTFCTGLFAHGFMLMNIINNHGSIAYTPGGYGRGIILGRWFLTVLGSFVDRVWGNYTLPLFDGIIALLLISVSVCIMVSILEIRSKLLAYVCGMLFVSFPSLVSSMMYMYTVHYYALAIFLAVLGVYWGCSTVRGRFFGSLCCFALSLGIYQAYMPLAASLYLLVLLRKGFTVKNLSGKKLLGMGIRYLLSLILGFLLYYGILQISLVYYHATLNSYQGIDKMGLQLRELPEVLKMVYRKFLLLSKQQQYSVNLTSITRGAFLFSQIMSAVVFGVLEGSRKTCRSAKIWNIVFFLLFPAAANGIIVMCFHSWIYAIMVYGLVTVYFLPIELLEAARQNIKDGSRRAIAFFLLRFATVLTAVVLSVTALNYIWQANGNYVVLYYANRQVDNYFIDLVGRIRNAEGYKQELPLAVVGTVFSDDIESEYADITAFKYEGNISAEEFINSYHVMNGWLSLYCGFAPTLVSGEELGEILMKEEVQDMPCYPDDGSIQVIDDVIVLKLENTETGN